ncbi:MULTISPECIES: ABC transporter permease [Basfia]|uniref:DppB protein n=2 Tax=Basfia TaxID=697331 RepID=Q65U98_MANSM|nr:MULTISPECIES: ABC transporter permease subunit [Basfia]AAU37462.1 DppB protein [[Mannheimia] succiniciproducens MBEL55E]QIM68265.1 peptide ABC transporter permease [Basfia succiniciproducens]SCX74783.1 cationic peptide transport system permease protein [Basfia succiniciproducens]SEQ62862.1 cationic peptide transport system permease protein [Basfia succiniciproducens]
MLYSFLRRLFLLLIILVILSAVSYTIFMRDPINQVFAEPYFYSGYFTYVDSLLKGDLGITYNGGDSLLMLILTVLPPTLELCFAAMIVAFLFGVPFGLLGAFFNKNIFGKAINAVSSLGLSVPVFWIAPILLYVAAIQHWQISAVGQINLLYEIKPITGFATIDVWFVDEPYRTKVIQNVFQHLILPTLVLAITPTMEITKLIQQRTEYILAQNYVKLSITRGWPIWRILTKYVLRNSLPLVIPQIPRLITFVLAQGMLIEGVFGWPGIGRWLIDAVSQQDYNSISAGVIVIGLFIIVINALTEILTFILDPFNKKGWYAR